MEKGKYSTDDLTEGDVLGNGQGFYFNTLVRFSLLASFVLQLIGFGLLAFFIRSQQSIVILHYNVYFGVDLIGVWEQAFIVPSIALVFVIVNMFLAQWFYNQKERVAAYVLLLVSISISLGSVLACASIAFINY